MADELDRENLDERCQRDRLNAVKNWLAGHDRWLLVADGLSTIDHLLELLPSSHTGKLLITGETHLDHPDLIALDHGPLNPDNAREFLERRSRQAIAPSDEKIVALFDGCTLSISLAAAYCHATKTELVEFHTRVLQFVEAQVDKSVVPAGQQVIHGVVDQSLRHVSATNPAALELMALCAFLAPVGIPLVTLYDGSPFLPKRLSACVTEPESLNEALSLLFGLGLIQFEDNGLCIHPYIQESTRCLLGKEQEAAWMRTALRVVYESFPLESQYLHPIPQHH